MRVIGSLFVILAALLVAPPVRANEAKLVHVVRFTDYELGPLEDWLQGKGWRAGGHRPDLSSCRGRCRMGWVAANQRFL